MSNWPNHLQSPGVPSHTQVREPQSAMRHQEQPPVQVLWSPRSAMEGMNQSGGLFLATRWFKVVGAHTLNNCREISRNCKFSAELVIYPVILRMRRFKSRNLFHSLHGVVFITLEIGDSR